MPATLNVLRNLPASLIKTNGDESGWPRTNATDGDDESWQSHWSGTPLDGGVAGSWFAVDLAGWPGEIDTYRVFTDTRPSTDSPQNIATEVRLYSTNVDAKWAALTHGSGLMTDDPVADLGWTLRAAASGIPLTAPADTGRRHFTGSTDRYWLFKAISGGTSEWDVNEFELWSEYLHGTSRDVARCDHNHRVEHLRSNEVDPGLHLHPDGSGGLEWGPETEHALDDLTDVDTASAAPTDGQALVYNSGSGLWVPGDVAAGGGSGAGSYAETIGNGAATSFDVAHGLGSTDVVVQLYDLTGASPSEATADAASILVIDASTVRVTFGSAPASGAYRVVVVVASAAPRTVVLGTDRTRSATSLADVTGLSFALAANKAYAFWFGVIVGSPATTTGIHLALNGPTQDRLFYSREIVIVGSSAPDWLHTGGTGGTSYDTGVASSSLAGNVRMAQIRGTIHTTAAGTFIVRFASEVDGSLVTVYAGSFGVLTPLG